MKLLSFFESEVEERTEIYASHEALHDALFDWDAYDQWNPYIRAIHGEPIVGQPIEVHFAAGPRLTVPLVCTLREYDEEELFIEWEYRAPYSFLYTAIHRFSALEISPGQFVFTQTEQMKGFFGNKQQWLIHFFMKKSFKAMNKALKRRAETLLA